MRIKSSSTPAQQSRAGFSLVETVVATFLVGMVVVTALQSLGASLKSHSVSRNMVRAELLAGQLLAELSAMEWTDPDKPTTAGRIGLDSGDPAFPIRRTQLDDLDDFDAWTEAPPAAAWGSALVGVSGWSRSVTVRNILPDDGKTELADDDDRGLRKVTVTILQDGTVLSVATVLFSRDEARLMTDGFEISASPW
jgi:Tfp pilus assembly protein PilV